MVPLGIVQMDDTLQYKHQILPYTPKDLGQGNVARCLIAGETNWYEFATLSPQERQGIIDAISKTCAEVPLLQQPFWRHQPELYRYA